MAAEVTERWHGSPGGYTNHACRCPACTDAWTREAARMRNNRILRLRADPTLAQHGSDSTYNNWGCRCQACTQAHAERTRLRRQR